MELLLRNCQDTAIWKQFQDEQLPPLDDAWLGDLLELEEAKEQAEENAASPSGSWEAQAEALFGDQEEEA